MYNRGKSDETISVIITSVRDIATLSFKHISEVTTVMHSAGGKEDGMEGGMVALMVMVVILAFLIIFFCLMPYIKELTRYVVVVVVAETGVLTSDC